MISHCGGKTVSEMDGSVRTYDGLCVDGTDTNGLENYDINTNFDAYLLFLSFIPNAARFIFFV